MMESDETTERVDPPSPEAVKRFQEWALTQGFHLSLERAEELTVQGKTARDFEEPLPEPPR